MSAEPESFDHASAIVACANGDRQALRRIYQAEAGRMVGVALRIVRRRDVAEDVVHDSFLRLWQHASSFDPQRGSGRAWIYSIVRYRALNLVRDRARETTIPDQPSDQLGQVDESAMSETFSGAFLGERLADCLAQLGAANRSCVLLAYIEGCSHSEVAQRMNAPLGSVKSWIRRGLLSLRECLS